jgi:excisionase family DNA binding protein
MYAEEILIYLLNQSNSRNRTTDRKILRSRVMAEQPLQADALLTPAEVAALFRVNPKTVTRWARAGKITAIRTLGGHRRFRASEIRRCLEQMEHTEA